MAGKNKKGPKNPCREELIALQGVHPSNIATQKTKKEKRAEKEKLEEMNRAAYEAKYGSSEVIEIPEAMWISVGKKGKKTRKGKKGKKGGAVAKKEVEEEANDSDSTESSDVSEIEWNLESDSEEHNLMAKNKVAKKIKTKGTKTSKKSKLPENDEVKGTKYTKNEGSIDWTAMNEKHDASKYITKKDAKEENAEKDKAQQQEKQKEQDGREAKKLTKKEKKKIANARRKAKKKAEALEKATTANKVKLSEAEITSDSAKTTIPVRVDEGDTSESGSESETDSEVESEPGMSTSSLKPLDRTNQIHLMNLYAPCNNCHTTNALLAARIEELESQRKPLQLSLNRVENWIATNLGDNYVPKIVDKKQKGYLGRKHKLGRFDKFVGPGAEASGEREWLQEQIRPLEDLIAAYDLEMKTGVLTCKILRYAKYVHSYGSKILTLDGLEITPESEIHPKDKARHEHVTTIFKEMQKLKAQIALLDAKDEVEEMVPEDKGIHSEGDTIPSEKLVFDAMTVYMVMLTMWFLATVFFWLIG